MAVDLHCLARRVRNLGRVNLRHGPEAAAVERDDIAEALARVATTSSTAPTAPTWWRAATPTPAPAGDDLTVRRLRALVAHHAQEAERLRRLLASAAPRARRRHRGHDPRQEALDL
ncbi:MAG: hypothetical protein EA356_13455 [Geminicoccaceae bacterium]|nr:MAG: hypothetical protein EA356_13455 [Geminicoccaceae bacterium]